MRIDHERMSGRRIFITGGGSGIGRAAAIRLAAEGAVVAISDIRAESLDDVVAEIESAGGRAAGFVLDVGDDEQTREVVSQAALRLGGLDGVFANAGTAGAGWIHDTPLADWEAVLRVNLTGVFLTAKYTIPHLLESGGGSIVTTGSIASYVVGMGGSSASYTASKGGVLQLTKHIAVDYGPQGIRANCLCPGGVKTDLARHVGEDMAGRAVPNPAGGRLPQSYFKPPIVRMSEPDEQAAVAVFLLSDDASFVTGTAVMVDGGYTAI